MNPINPITDPMEISMNIYNNSCDPGQGVIEKLLEKYKPKRKLNIVKPIDRILDIKEAA